MAVLDHGITIHFKDRQDVVVRVVVPRDIARVLAEETGQELRARVMRALLDLRTMFLAAAAVQAALVLLVDPMVLPLVEQGYKIAF